MVKSINEISDWELIVLTNHECRRRLPFVSDQILDECLALVWSLQDGYGVEGKTPSQGWDWSGIRDSSDKAKRKMGKALRDLFGLHKIKEIEIVD